MRRDSGLKRLIAQRVAGCKIDKVWRRGKRIVMQLSSKDAFIIEPRMTGLLLLADPPDREHLRVEWRLSRGGKYSSFWFWDRRGLGTVTLASPAELEEYLSERRIGKDALDMKLADWRARCAATSRPIKVTLLDQKLVAGIGNLYASEILHLARISPECPANRLSTKEILRMARAVERVLQNAIKHEGSTLSDGTYRNALNQAGSAQQLHRVYDREGEPCKRCRKETIRRIVQAQRSTFYCPGCQ
jgi:formamidopyrimidine-DNA glycosylase